METRQLILSYFSLGAGPLQGATGPGVTFEQRVSAASAAGFSGVGLWGEDYKRSIASGALPGTLRAIADDHGVAVSELEVLDGWAVREPVGDQAAKERLFHEMADVFGSRHLHVMGPFDGSIDDAAEAFAGVCDRAAEHGLLVALEAMPFTNITDFGIGLDIVERAGRANGGLCLDAWHHFRGANDFDLLRAVPVDRIVSVQLDDGTAEPEVDDYVADTISNRRPPGEGAFDLRGFIDELDRLGFVTPLSVEVLSTELSALDPMVAALRLGDATRALLATA